jgi:hypothetical protein
MVSETPEELQRQMARLRSEAREDVENVIDRAEELIDWRYYVRRHPWACLAAGVAVGYLLVPPRRQIISPDADTLLELASRHKLVVETSPRSTPRTRVVSGLLGLAGRFVLREAMALASRKVADLVERNGVDRNGAPAPHEESHA